VRTFVVRIWAPHEPDVEGQDPLRGLVEQVGGGRSSTPFAGETELLALLREADPGGTAKETCALESTRTRGGRP
jgi:hypothetical protein